MARRSRRTRMNAEINLTPLIDVMTSLLAIFMITAPLLTSGIVLDLPKGDGKQIEGDEKTLDIGIDADGQIYVGADKIQKADLIKKVRAVVAENPGIGMMVSGDKASAYGTVLEVMAMLRVAGFTQVGLKTDAKVAVPE